MSDLKRQKLPDVDAIEEDEKQYSSGPLSITELEEQYIPPSRVAQAQLAKMAANVPTASPIARTTTREPSPSPLSSKISSTRL